MAGLTVLGPFLRLCQISGLVPFRMEIDPQTKQFQRFVFSYFHPITVWYVLSNILAMNQILLTGLVYQQLQTLESVLWAVIRWISFGFGAGLLFLPFFSYHIRNVVKMINQFDETLKPVTTKPSFTVARRTFMCVVFGLIPVKSFQSYIDSNTFNSLLNPRLRV